MQHDELVVIGCPIANRSWCFDAWWENATRQTKRWRAAFVYSPSEDDTLGKLEQAADWHDVSIIHADEPLIPRTRAHQDSHQWPIEHFADMARWRNSLLSYCEDIGAEWFFSVDSDIMLPALTFEILRAVLMPRLDEGFGAIAPLVNMAVHLDAHAYNFMQWHDADTAMASRPGTPLPTEPFQAGVIMAAMLIHRSAFGVRWHEHPQGEDLGWSYDARSKGVRLLVDPGIICNHLMKRTH